MPRETGVGITDFPVVLNDVQPGVPFHEFAGGESLDGGVRQNTSQ